MNTPLDTASRLQENTRALRALSVSQIFSTPEAFDPPVFMASDDPAAKLLQKAQHTESELSAEVSRLRSSLHEADQRTLNVAECHRRQVEIRVTLLEAAHREALHAKEEAIAEARAQRAATLAAQQELHACREQLELVQRTRDAEIVLQQQQQQEQVTRMSSELSTGRVSLAVMEAELKAIDRPSYAGAGAAAARGGVPMPVRAVSALRELRQWVGVAAVADGQGGKQDASLVSHLRRLEEAADAAARRFDELQEDHNALRRRYRRLRQQASAPENKTAAHVSERASSGEGHSRACGET